MIQSQSKLHPGKDMIKGENAVQRSAFSLKRGMLWIQTHSTHPGTLVIDLRQHLQIDWT